MINRNVNYNRSTGIVDLKAPDGYDKVQQNCVVTPAAMEDALQKGIPISQFMMPDSAFDDGSDSPSLLMIEQRGIDINDVWNATKDIKSKIKKVHKSGLEFQNSNIQK